MSSLSQNDISAIGGVLALRSHDKIVDLDELVARTDDSIENLLGNSEIYGVDANRFIAHVNSEEEDHHTKSLEKTTTSMKDRSPAGDSLGPHYFAGPEASGPIEDCGNSSTESEHWREYLDDFPEESLSPVRMSTYGSVSEGDEELNENIFGMYYGEASTYDYVEDWATVSISDRDLVAAQTNMRIDESFVEISAPSEAHVASIESWIDWIDWSKAQVGSSDWAEWSKLFDNQISNEKKSKKLQKKCRRKVTGGAKTRRCQPTREAAGIVKGIIKKYRWSDKSNHDFRSHSIVKLKVALKAVD